MNELESQLARLARVPVLLVASDYDGTLAPIVADPAEARPQREVLVSLRTLAALPHTHVAVISGRALGELARLIGPIEKVHFVGSHGSEFDPDFASTLDAPTTELRERLQAEVSAIAGTGAGFLVELKPAGVAFHYRNAEDARARAALQAIAAGPGARTGVFTRHAKRVVELSVVDIDKGKALATIRTRVGASAVLFLGDDATDEDAFATLSGPDVGVKVGEGETGAAHRVADTEEVARLLAFLSEQRSAWAAGAAAGPIERPSLLSDQRAVALAAPSGSLVWLCVPRIDSPALFAELLGGPPAGRFAIRAADGSAPRSQAYLPGTLVLETRWSDFRVTDFLDCSSGRPSQRAGRSDLIRVLEGTGRVEIEFSPRLDFGRQHTRLARRPGGLVVEGTLDPIVLRSPGIEWELLEEGVHQTARGRVDLAGGPVTLELRYGSGSLREGSPTAEDRRRLTAAHWSAWYGQLLWPAGVQERVRSGALLLRALCHGPSGAIAAAATTSLPEAMGGVRNWDYRYCWLRDSAMSATTLVRLGSTAEAMHLLGWVLGIVDACASPAQLQPLYGVAGAANLPEGEVGELAGYAGSRPVRVGNAASRQVQLDVFGTIVELVYMLTERDAPLSSEHWRLVEAMVQAVEQRWFEPDHGIWEIRRPRRHHVYSKVMCWQAVDRAIRIAQRLLERETPAWEQLRGRIARDVLDQGYKREVNAFTAAYDGTDLDAASLQVGLSGLLPPDDPRFVGTVEAVERDLRKGPTVYRYRADDGLPGVEGGFHLCAAWLIDAYLLLGRKDEARELFDSLCALIGPTGLLSEQYDPVAACALGNTPQAYSHLGLIDSALRLAASSA